jgi:hypothetical protein
MDFYFFILWELSNPLCFEKVSGLGSFAYQPADVSMVAHLSSQRAKEYKGSACCNSG